MDQVGELWLRAIVAEPDSQVMALQEAMKGPTFKVVIIVDGISTRALLDSGAKVSLAQQQLLPHIKVNRTM